MLFSCLFKRYAMLLKLSSPKHMTQILNLASLLVERLDTSSPPKNTEKKRFIKLIVYLIRILQS